MSKQHMVIPSLKFTRLRVDLSEATPEGSIFTDEEGTENAFNVSPDVNDVIPVSRFRSRIRLAGSQEGGEFDLVPLNRGALNSTVATSEEELTPIIEAGGDPRNRYLLTEVDSSLTLLGALETEQSESLQRFGQVFSEKLRDGGWAFEFVGLTVDGSPSDFILHQSLSQSGQSEIQISYNRDKEFEFSFTAKDLETKDIRVPLEGGAEGMFFHVFAQVKPDGLAELWVNGERHVKQIGLEFDDDTAPTTLVGGTSGLNLAALSISLRNSSPDLVRSLYNRHWSPSGRALINAIKAGVNDAAQAPE